MPYSLSPFRIFVLAIALPWSYVSETPAQESNAGEIYHQYCSVCHGDRGDGRSRARQGLVPPPRDFTTPESAASLTRERMIKAVLDGRPGTAMTGWRTRLSQDQTLAVVDYIRERFMQTGKPESETAASVKRVEPGSKQTPGATQRRAMRGNFESGRTLYAGNCATCHGLNGDGNGPRAYFIFPKPRNFLSAETRSALDRERLFLAVSNGVQGREMPAWRHVLSESQIADVSEFVYRAFLRPDEEVSRQ